MKPTIGMKTQVCLISLLTMLGAEILLAQEVS